jgi:succinoglycan biosynthesis transport protein ExoP
VNAVGAEGPDVREYLRLVRRRGWILIACVILIPLGIYLYTAQRPKVFTASTILQVQSSVDPAAVTSPTLAQGSANVQAIAQFVSTTAVSDEAARLLHLPKGSLNGAGSATADQDTGFITITASGSTAQRATSVANAFAGALNATRQKQGVQRVDAAIASVQKDLAKAPRSDAATRAQLSQQLRSLQTLKQAQSQNVSVIQPANGAAQIAPHPKRNATVGILLAILIGFGLILLTERIDRKLRKPEDLEKLTGMPFLGTIPHEAFPGEDTNAEVLEAFQTLRNTLTYFNADDQLSSLMVTSALKGEGKTTVAANLAVAYAMFGKRVILVDTDLRKPDLAGRLGIEESPGLSDILAGNANAASALREFPGDLGHGLRLLPAGAIPPNPSALLGSLRMASLLDELGQDADIVILDSAPLLMVSDAFPLLDKVGGILALARLDQTPRDAVRRMAQIAVSAGGQVLGFVATDAKRALLGGYGYGYGYGYGAERNASGGDGKGTGPSEAQKALQ